MNIAQRFYGGLCDLPDHPEADLKLAMQQTHTMSLRYKPATSMNHLREKTLRKAAGKPRLFKGHRV